jgi:hypothetical protein
MNTSTNQIAEYAHNEVSGEGAVSRAHISQFCAVGYSLSLDPPVK